MRRARAGDTVEGLLQLTCEGCMCKSVECIQGFDSPPARDGQTHTFKMK